VKITPTAEELANPDKRDEQILREKLKTISHSFGLVTPEFSLANIPGLHNLSDTERHKQELPVLQDSVSKLINDGVTASEKIQIKWLESGKPVVDFQSS
jgi:hypothetical protein